MPETLILPDGREVMRPGWSPGTVAVAEREAQMRGRFYVVNIGGNAGLGEVWRCKNCHGRHGYLTRNCTERPFNGLDQAVWAIYQQAGDLASVRSLSPSQQLSHRARQVRLMPVIADLPDLSMVHPDTARQINQQRQLGAFDIEIGGLKLGRVEQIPKSLAQRLLDKCNQNQPIGARLHVEGLTA
jgi:hypothetical protein